jgi:hypothetical protein
VREWPRAAEFRGKAYTLERLSDLLAAVDDYESYLKGALPPVPRPAEPTETASETPSTGTLPLRP